ncbi:DNA repair exonuclease [Bacillus carboniphilus]|uniref:DNA repair exonuclease n=1 Tax=Bacillus carboniphilus TaxID=86663 RepID=A0ABY9JTX0_9BACI|nr:DNA repair exonuclease [Bacillus carboniphilus]WLR42835.1 DNA repair exonuclease [Bacillus carboniphilus]
MKKIVVLRRRLAIRQGFERLKDENIPVYIVHGNHDFTGGRWSRIEWPENVHVFSDRKVEAKDVYKDEQLVATLYGYSYPKKAVYEPIVDSYIKQSNAPFHIGLLHGSDGSQGHHPYCPFTVKQLLHKEFDYWALGHIHKRQFLHKTEPFITYPGNIQGRHRKETGNKGVYVVEMSKLETTLHFYQTSLIHFEKEEIHVESMQTIDDLITKIDLVKQRLKDHNHNTIIEIDLRGKAAFYYEMMEQGELDDVVEYINAPERDQESVVWLSKIHLHITPPDDEDNQGGFYSDIKKMTSDDQVLKKALQSYEKHPFFRKLDLHFSEEEKQEIVEDASRRLQYFLNRG